MKLTPRITGNLWNIPQTNKEKPKRCPSTCNRLHLEALGSRPMRPTTSPGTWLEVGPATQVQSPMTMPPWPFHSHHVPYKRQPPNPTDCVAPELGGGVRILGPLHTRAKGRDHEFVGAQNEKCPKAVPTHLQRHVVVVTVPQV